VSVVKFPVIVVGVYVAISSMNKDEYKKRGKRWLSDIEMRRQKLR